MDTGKSNPIPAIRRVLILWGVACMAAAFFIPHYDFGFDGIKVWGYICLLMLVVLLVSRWGLAALQRR